MSAASPADPAVGLKSRSTEFGLAIAIFVVIGLTTLLDTNHSYWSAPKISAVNIIRSTVMLGIFALGSAIVIIAGGIDLSSGSMIAFGGTSCAALLLLLNPEGMQTGHLRLLDVVLAIAGTLVVGFLVGSLHAWLITVIGLPPFVATLATLVGLRSLGRAVVEGVNQAMLGSSSTQINVYDENFRYLATSVWIPAVVFLALSAFFWVLMSRTVVGRHLYAMGGNEVAARLSGIRTERLKWFAYCLSSMCASIAGILYICAESVAEPQTLGRGYELNAIAAAVVGGCSLQGGIGTIPGVMLGCLFLRSVIDGISKIIKSSADLYEGLIVGIVVVVAVAFSSRSRQKQFFPGALGWVAALTLSLFAGILAALLVGKSAGALAGSGALAVLIATKLWERRAAA